MVKTQQQQKIKTPLAAYMGYLFQSFLKRPFGYIIAVLYILYLAIILLIVPASLHFEPLFIWNVGGFNMPIFNLFFIAAAAASIAVAVFRTSRDDGMELTLSAKPLTKGTTVAMKTIVYLLIMLAICIIITMIVSLTYPVFGEFNEITNPTGITLQKYQGLLLSIFVGNVVNMLFFGGIAVFISMVGGQVIIMIGTIGIVFLMCLLNFLFPQVAKTATEVLSDKYDTTILGYSCNTLAQYNNPDGDMLPYNFATIQCVTDDEDVEGYHYDTYEYWTKAEKEAARKALNYIDFGKQLSSLYNAFGLDESKLKEASKLVIGTNSSYDYHIDPETHVDSQEMKDAKNYPISFYGASNSQGKYYPVVVVVGGNMSITGSNWYLWSTLYQVDFNSVICATPHPDDLTLLPDIPIPLDKTWFRMSELIISDEQKEASEALYKTALEKYTRSDYDRWSQYSHDVIAQDTSGKFFEPGTFDSLNLQTKFKIIAQNHLYWSVLSNRDQTNSIQQYCTDKGITDAQFPYPTKIVNGWQYDTEWRDTQPKITEKNDFWTRAFVNNILVDSLDENNKLYSFLNTGTMSYAETYANLYQYTVTSFYNLTNIIAIWTTISCALFTTAVIVYKKTDFK